MAPAEFKNFKLVEDLGIRFMDYSNAGAGHYTGSYRSFLIQEGNGDSQIISFSIFGTIDRTPLDPQRTHRTSFSSLAVAIDKFKESKTVLQYNIDRYAQFEKDRVRFPHDGRMSRVVPSDVRSYIANYAELITCEHNALLLGEIPSDKLLYLYGDAESKLMYRMMEYALLREKFKSGLS